MLGSKSRRAVAALATALVVAGGGVTAGSAQAADGDLFVDGCLARSEAPTCPGGLPGLPLGMATSPDGRQVYVAMAASAAGSYDGLKIFDRAATTGVAVPRAGAAGCVAPPGSAGGCTSLPQPTSMVNAYDVAVAPDGRNVYVVAYDGSLLNFARNTTSGSLGFVNCVGNGTGCAPLTATAAPRSVAVSPDSRHVYAKTNVGLAVLDRNDTTRRIAQKPSFDGCFSEEAGVPGCDEVDGIYDHSYGMEVSPDGRHVYVAFRSPGGVGVFNRAQDGTLSQPNGQAGGCISSNGNSAEATRCKDGNDALGSSFVTTVSPDGLSVYVAGINGIVAYRRNPVSGYLAETGCYGSGVGCTAVPAGLSYVFDMAVTPDGRELVAAAYNSRSAVSFRRNPSTGALTPRSGARGCLSAILPTCLSLPLLSDGHISRLALDPSGLRFYLANGSGMLATITRDYAPICRSTTIDVPFNTAISIPLSCTDANGDRMTLEKGRLPAKGQLGEVIGGAAFSARSRTTSADTFTFRARTLTRGVNGPYATISVNVAAPRHRRRLRRRCNPVGSTVTATLLRRAGLQRRQRRDSAGRGRNQGRRPRRELNRTAEPFPTLSSGVGNSWT